MAEVIGKTSCPVCGEPYQDIKVNKNQKLYLFCDNGCSAKLDGKTSKICLAELEKGKTTRFFSQIIIPIKGLKNEGNKDIDVKTETRDSGRNPVDGRTGGGDTGSDTGSVPAPKRRSWFDIILGDDDE